MKTKSLKFFLLPILIVFFFVVNKLSSSVWHTAISEKKHLTKSATAFQDTRGNSASPTVIITQSHIKSTWTVPPFGCGQINHTLLNGPSGNYSLGQGDANVNPGTYSLHIDGKVVETSGTRCGYGKIEITLSYD